MVSSTFLVFVQERDVCPLVRAHSFGADAVADSSLFTVDLAKSTIQVPLPVDLITVDLIGKTGKTNKISSNTHIHKKIAFNC